MNMLTRTSTCAVAISIMMTSYGPHTVLATVLARSSHGRVATHQHYITMIWSLDTHAKQMDFLDRMEAAGGEEAWDLHPDVYAAQFMALQNEDRYEGVTTLTHSDSPAPTHFLKFRGYRMLLLRLPNTRGRSTPSVPRLVGSKPPLPLFADDGAGIYC